MSAVPVVRRAGVQVHPVTQVRVVRSEWIKLQTLRSTWFTVGIAILALVGVGFLVSWATAAHWAQGGPGQRIGFDPVQRSLVGVFLAQLAVGVLGVLAVTGEYSTGMIRSTLTAVPRRLPVLWAKLAVVAALIFAVMLVASIVTFLGGQALLGPHGTTFSHPGALRAVVGVALYLTVVAVFAIGLGFSLRSTAGGIATLVALLLILPVLANALPSSWQADIIPYLPGQAGGAIYRTRYAVNTMAPWTGFAVFCAWAAAAVGLGAYLLRRRDA